MKRSSISKNIKRIIYFYPTISSFIQKDINIFSSHYQLVHLPFGVKVKYYPFEFLIQLKCFLVNLNRNTIIVCRFAGFHTILPVIVGKLFSIKVNIILGGTECHKFPSINYGAYLRYFYSLAIKISLRNASLLLPVHQSLMDCKYDYDYSGAPRQGCKVFCENLNTPFVVINNGNDGNSFYYTGTPRVANSFISVANNYNGGEYFRKGTDLIIEIAKQLSHCSFTLIGNVNWRKDDLPSNLIILSAVPNTELKEYYSKHEFYLQLSLAEGFPNALCEGMLCGCIPIGANTFGIPEIIDDTGFILREKSVQLLIKLINQALISDKQRLSQKARNRILENYTIERRSLELIKILENQFQII